MQRTLRLIPRAKNGSGIHIKKSHKGLFTKYCNGKVTLECILKGKNSSDPAVRKRATFAENARHFKHKEGAKLSTHNTKSVLDSTGLINRKTLKLK